MITTETTAQPAAQLALPKHSALPAAVRGFRPDIQGLRAVAVVLVVLYHSAVPFITGGFVGVDVFFVISGFLITQHLLKEAQATGTLSLSRFYARRIRRLLPSALLVIALTLIVARVWGPALQATSTARDGFFATFYSINYWLAAEGIDYQHAASSLSPLQHFWSLAVEEQFYLIWPLILLVVVFVFRRVSRRAALTALVIVIVAIAVFSLNESMTVTVSDAPLAYFSLQTRAWELAAGALVAILAPLLARIPNPIAATASWTGLVAIGLSALIFNDSTAFPGLFAIVPVLGAVLIIASGLVERRNSVERLLEPRPVQFLGTVSYGWYLWHWPLIVLGPSVMHTRFGWGENLEMSFLALWFAVLSYLILERSVLKQRLSRRAWYVRGVIASATVAAVAISLIYVVPPTIAGTGAAASTLKSSVSQTALVSQLQTAIASVAVPSNLTPTLARANTDVPVTSTDGCHADYSAITNGTCVFGDATASRTILLFGDSHAQQWFAAVDSYAKSRHWRLVSWTKVACPIARMTVENEVLKRAYIECDQWHSQTLKDIARLHPDVVVASQADALAGGKVADQVWGARTALTIAAIRKITPSVVFLEDTPHPDADPSACLAQNLTDSSLCDVSTTTASVRYLVSRRKAVAASLGQLGVPVIDPTAWFCVSGTCPAIVGNVLVYRDIGHATQTYVGTLEPVLAEALTPYLPKATTN